MSGAGMVATGSGEETVMGTFIQIEDGNTATPRNKRVSKSSSVSFDTVHAILTFRPKA